MKDERQERMTLKQKLKLVFDDDLSTKLPTWKNWWDYAIITLIVVSTLAVFLSTFNVLKEYNRVFNIIDCVTVICFTIEIALRIWSADELDKRYNGWMGRLRYCVSFYGLIDLVSVVPFYINLFLPAPWASLHIVRVLRFMRLFHYMKSSNLLFSAIKSKKKELIISLSFLTLLTVVLSVLLFYVEHDAQSEQCENGWQTFVWAFAKYLGDPGKIADFTLQTPAANIIAFIVGILGVGIFAVPTGIISSGFTEALEDKKKSEELKEYHQRMLKAFKRTTDFTLRDFLDQHSQGEKPPLMYFSPQRIPVARILIRQGIDMKDIFSVCKEYAEFRMKNLAEAYSSEKQVDDRFVVEYFPHNRSYGCCIDRNSRVTIVSPSSFNDNGTGWFTYYLAKMGGFNYVSKDIEVDPDETDSFYNMTEEPKYDDLPLSHYRENEKKNEEAINIIAQKEQNRKAFLDDLRALAHGENNWVIFFIAHLKNSQNLFDFHFSASKMDGSDLTVNQIGIYEQLCQLLSQHLENDRQLTCDLRSKRYPLPKNFVGYKLQREGISQNCFVIRPSCDIINFDNRRMVVAYSMAGIISKILDNNKGMEADDAADFETKTYGYQENKMTERP